MEITLFLGYFLSYPNILLSENNALKQTGRYLFTVLSLD